MSLDDFLDEKVRTLRSLLASVETDIRNRLGASVRVREAIADHYRLVKDKLLALDAFPILTLPVVDQQRSTLAHQLDTLRHETRKEIVNLAETVARLRAEYRQWWKQYRDLAQRTALLQPSSPNK